MANSKLSAAVNRALAVFQFLDENKGLEYPFDPTTLAPPPGPVSQMLARAINAKNALAYQAILEMYLDRVGLSVPKGVFNPDPPNGSPGRPPEKDLIFMTWAVSRLMGDSGNHPTAGEVAVRLGYNCSNRGAAKKAADKVGQRIRQFEKRYPGPKFYRDIALVKMLAGIGLESAEDALEALRRQVSHLEDLKDRKKGRTAKSRD